MSETQAVLWHNPRCSKSRMALNALEEKNVDFEIRLYLKDEPTFDEIKNIYTKLNIASVKDMFRTKETEYTELNIKACDDETTLIQHLVDTPKLLERPIFVTKSKAAIGRPLANIMDICR